MDAIELVALVMFGLADVAERMAEQDALDLDRILDDFEHRMENALCLLNKNSALP